MMAAAIQTTLSLPTLRVMAIDGTCLEMADTSDNRRRSVGRGPAAAKAWGVPVGPGPVLLDPRLILGRTATPRPRKATVCHQMSSSRK
jgi:hypothetical protein